MQKWGSSRPDAFSRNSGTEPVKGGQAEEALAPFRVFPEGKGKSVQMQSS